MQSGHIIEIEHLTKDFRVYARSFATIKSQMTHTLQRILQRDTARVFTMRRALDDVSFNIARGETVAIIGHNGSGKSTLLSILSRIYLPTSGEVRLRGRVSSLLELGLGFDPELTGIENIFFSCTLRGMTREAISEHYESMRHFAELDAHTMSLPVRMYSSGMQARLAFAVAIHVDSDLLLIDEGLAVGDIRFQEKCLDRLIHIKATGKTIFLVSHDHHVVRRFADRAIWLDKGAVRMDGLSQPVVDAYEAHMLG